MSSGQYFQLKYNTHLAEKNSELSTNDIPLKHNHQNPIFLSLSFDGCLVFSQATNLP